MKLANGNFFKITELFAFVSVHPNGQGEGIMAVQLKDGLWMPLIGADLERIEQLKPIADQMVEGTDIHYELRYFKAV